MKDSRNFLGRGDATVKCVRIKRIPVGCSIEVHVIYEWEFPLAGPCEDAAVGIDPGLEAHCT